MRKIVEVVKEYLAIVGKYDGGKNYTWDMAYREVKRVTEKMYNVSKRCRTSEGRFIARAVYEQMNDELKRLYLLAYNYKEAKREG